MVTNNLLFFSSHLTFLSQTEASTDEHKTRMLEMLTFGGGKGVEKFNLKSFRVVFRMIDNVVPDCNNWERILSASKNNMKLLLKVLWFCSVLIWVLLNVGQMGQTDKNWTADVGRYPGSCLISSHMNYQNRSLICRDSDKNGSILEQCYNSRFCHEEVLKLKFLRAEHRFIWKEITKKKKRILQLQ